MSVQPITFGSSNSYVREHQKKEPDVNSVVEKSLYGAGMLIPTARRLSSAPESAREQDYTRVGLLAGLAVANLPRDVEEVKFAVNEAKNLFKNGVKYEGQHKTTFFKNTLLQPLADKYKWLNKLDKTAYDTNFGKLTRKSLGITKPTETKFFESGKRLAKYSFKGNYLQKLTGRALLRTSTIGTAITGVLEIPKLVKSITKTKGTGLDKAKSFGKQFLKSAAYVGLITAGISLGGAALIPAGYIASLVGMGIGSAVALEGSKGFNKLVDKVIT